MVQHPDHQPTDMIPESTNMTDNLPNPDYHPDIRNTLTASDPNGRTPLNFPTRFSKIKNTLHHPQMANPPTLIFNLNFIIHINLGQSVPKSEEGPGAYGKGREGIQYVHEMENKSYIDAKLQPEKEAMHESPVSVGEASNGTIFFGSDQDRVSQVAEERRSQIVNRHKQDGTLYCDSSFKREHWIPSNDIISSAERTFRPWKQCVIKNKPTPGDVLQGKLANCWFLSALAKLTQFPDLLERVVQTRDQCDQGVYIIRLCIDGLWKTVIIDDCLPCDYDGKILFAQATNDQLWVPLVEKAMAKFHGSYKSLSYGRCCEAIAQLTGMPCDYIIFKDDYSHYDHPEDNLWEDLLYYFDSKYMMCASTDKSKDLCDVGLSPYHCYSVLAVEEKEEKRTITLRDPFGKSKWKGNVSADAAPNNHGIITMTFDDYLKYFESMAMGQTDPGELSHELRLQGVFSSSDRELDMTIWRLKVHVSTSLMLGLYQQGYRGTKLVLDVRLVVLRDDGAGVGKLVDQSLNDSANHVMIDTQLDPGEYLVVPLAFNRWHYGADSRVLRSNVLAVHSDKHVTCEEITDVGKDYGNIFADTVIQLAVAEGEKHEIQPGVTSYYETTFCGSILVIENGEEQALHVQCNNNTHSNVVSTRATLATHDVIPARHRQVIVILTKLVESGRPIQQPRLEVWLENHEPDSTDMARSTVESPSTTSLHKARPL